MFGQIRLLVYLTFIATLLATQSSFANDLLSKKNTEHLQLAKQQLNKNSDQEVLYLDSLKFSSNLPLDSSQRSVLKDKIHLLLELDSIHLAEQELLNHISLTERSEDEITKAWLHKTLAEVLLNQLKLDSSLHHVEKAIELYEKQNNEEEVGLTLLKKSSIESAKGDYIKSIETVFEASKYFEKTNQEKQLAFSYLQIGTTYLYIDFYDVASDYYKLAKKAFLRVNDTLGSLICQANLGLVELEKKNYKVALSLFRSAHQGIAKSKRQISISTSYRYIGYCFQGLNQEDSAIYYFKKALTIDSSLNYAMGISSDYFSLAEISFELQNIDLALQYAEKAIQYFERGGDDETEADLNLLMAEILQSLGRVDSSNKYFMTYANLQDSIIKEQEKIKRIASKENRKLETIRQELLLSKQEAMIKEEENKIQQYFIIIISIVAIVSLFLFGLISAANRRNRQLNKSLNLRNQQFKKDIEIKQALLKEVHHRVKNSLQVISSTLSLKAGFTSDEQLREALKEIKVRINSLSNIHESLYRENESDKKPFSSLIKKVIPHLENEYQKEGQFDYDLLLDDVYLSLDNSIPVGIFLCEVISNIFKHAYRNQRGFLSVKLFQEGKFVHLIIADKGVGLAKNINPKEEKSLGFLLINTMCKQVEGELEITQMEGLQYHLKWEARDDKLLT